MSECSDSYIIQITILFDSSREKMSLTSYTNSEIHAHARSQIRALYLRVPIQSIVSIDCVSRQRKSRSGCADVAADSEFRCLNTRKVQFSRVVYYLFFSR